jgi:hypothetical protein
MLDDPSVCAIGAVQRGKTFAAVDAYCEVLGYDGSMCEDNDEMLQELERLCAEGSS